jgi:hypothetical protein
MHRTSMDKLERHNTARSRRTPDLRLGVPPFIHDLLANPPRSGEGVHRWIFRVSRLLHAYLPASEIVSLLENAVSNCGRHVPRSEIIDAVKNSLVCAWQPSGDPARKPAVPKWPTVNHEQREAVARDNGGVVDLWELSRPRIEDSRQHTEDIIDQLFSGNPLLCCGRSHRDFYTRHREQWRGELARLQFVVPSPMTACPSIGLALAVAQTKRLSAATNL